MNYPLTISRAGSQILTRALILRSTEEGAVQQIPTESESSVEMKGKAVRDDPIDRSVNVDDTFGERADQVAAVAARRQLYLRFSFSPSLLPASAG